MRCTYQTLFVKVFHLLEDNLLMRIFIEIQIFYIHETRKKILPFAIFGSSLPYNDEFIEFMRYVAQLQNISYSRKCTRDITRNLLFRLFSTTAKHQHQMYDSVSCMKSFDCLSYSFISLSF